MALGRVEDCLCIRFAEFSKGEGTAMFWIIWKLAGFLCRRGKILDCMQAFN